jgi:hypothetical protein
MRTKQSKLAAQARHRQREANRRKLREAQAKRLVKRLMNTPEIVVGADNRPLFRQVRESRNGKEATVVKLN